MAKFLIGKEKSAFRKIKHAAAFQGSFNEKKTLLVLSEVAYACLHLHLSVPFSHFFVLDHPQRQLIGGRKGASAHEQRAEQGGCPGGRKQHSDDYKLVAGSRAWVTTRKHHTGHYSGNPHNP